MGSPEPIVNEKTPEEHPSSGGVVEIKVFQVVMTVQSCSIIVHLLLGLDILKAFSVIPPFWGGLHQYSVWLKLLNKFLCPLGKHVGLVHRSNQVNIFSIKTLCEVAQCCVKARVTTQINIELENKNESVLTDHQVYHIYWYASFDRA